MIAIVDYGLGNLASIRNMLRKIGVHSVVTSDPEVIGCAERLILPGVGAFDAGMENLEARGLVDPLTRRVNEGTPILGVCLGMQLFTRGSEEGQRPGLGWVDAETVRFRFRDRDKSLKIPHMGWNTVLPTSQHPLFAEMEEEARFYFVHSYYVRCDSEALCLGSTTYGNAFTSSLGQANILGVQWHPEKSHRFGMRLFRNFASLSVESGARSATDEVT